MQSNKPSSEKTSPTSTQSSNPSAQQPKPPEPSDSKYRKIEFRAAYGYDTKAASDEATYTDPGESLTIQAHAEDADINVLMRRYGITGKMPDNVGVPMYGDFTGITDYRSAVEAVRKAHEDFMEIPAEVRARFNNDPQALLEYASNPNNAPGLVELGLAKWREPASTTTAPQPTAAPPNATPPPVAPPPGPVPGPAATGTAK